MRGIVLTEPGSSVLTDLPDPSRAPMRCWSRSRCVGSAVPTCTSTTAVSPQPATPFTPGHELAGVVVDTGADVPWLASGTRVAVDPNIPCEHCHYCHIGRQNLCANYTAIGVTQPGGFAELVG